MSGYFSIARLTIVLTLSLLFFVPLGLVWSGIPITPAVKEYKAIPAVAEIQRLSELVALRKHITTTIEGENRHHKGKWHLEGDIILGVDLSQAYYTATNATSRTATLLLPAPHLVSHKVDHDRSFEISLNSKTWIQLSDPKAMRDDVWAAADRKIQKLGQVPENVSGVKEQAQTIIKDLFGAAGWQVTIQWRDGPQPTGL